MWNSSLSMTTTGATVDYRRLLAPRSKRFVMLFLSETVEASSIPTRSREQDSPLSSLNGGGRGCADLAALPERLLEV